MVRLRPGQSIQTADPEIIRLHEQVRDAALPPGWSPDDFLREGFTLTPAAGGASDLRERYRRPLMAMMVVVSLVLGVACANIVNLLLARAAVRRREFGLKTALGASRWRISRQLLCESVLLAAAGGALGALLAVWGSEFLVRQLSTSTNPVFLSLALNWRVLGFTAAVSTGTVLLFGAAPAMRAGQTSPARCAGRRQVCRWRSPDFWCFPADDRRAGHAHGGARDGRRPLCWKPHLTHARAVGLRSGSRPCGGHRRTKRRHAGPPGGIVRAACGRRCGGARRLERRAVGDDAAQRKYLEQPRQGSWRAGDRARGTADLLQRRHAGLVQDPWDARRRRSRFRSGRRRWRPARGHRERDFRTHVHGQSQSHRHESAAGRHTAAPDRWRRRGRRLRSGAPSRLRQRHTFPTDSAMVTRPTRRSLYAARRIRSLR